MNLLHASTFGTLVAAALAMISTPALADREGEQYRGKLHCNDAEVTDVLGAFFDKYKAWYDKKIKNLGSDARVNPIVLGAAQAGTLKSISKPTWYQAYREINKPGPTSTTIEKTAQGTCAANVLVCTFEYVPGSKQKAVMVNESAGRFAHDVPVGTKMSFVMAGAKEKASVYITVIQPESSYRTFTYKMTSPAVAAAAAEAK